MLANIAGVTQLFFDGLDSLIRNGISTERIVTALLFANIDLSSYINAARRLNEIDERRPYRIETAAKIAAEMPRAGG
jgi:hypothetical protein